MAKMRISPLDPKAAMTVYDTGIKNDKLVYLIVASRPIHYPTGRSHIAYIGSTEHGIARMAQSAAFRAQDILKLHGVSKFDVYPISAAARPGAKSWWKKLERAFIIGFREEFGDPPILNDRGRKFRRTNEFELFTESVVKDILHRLGADGRSR
jgi:hypothetical protein